MTGASSGAIFGSHRGDTEWVRRNRQAEQAALQADREAAQQARDYRKHGNDSEFELRYGLTKAEYRRAKGIYTYNDKCGHLFDYPG